MNKKQFDKFRQLIKAESRRIMEEFFDNGGLCNECFKTIVLEEELV